MIIKLIPVLNNDICPLFIGTMDSEQFNSLLYMFHDNLSTKKQQSYIIYLYSKTLFIYQFIAKQ